MSASTPRSRYAEVGARSHMPYEARLVRFTLMHAMRNGQPPYDRKLSLQDVADEMVHLGYERVSRERVRQLLKVPPTDPRLGEARLLRRRRDLEDRILRWQARGTELGNARAARYREELEALQQGNP